MTDNSLDARALRFSGVASRLRRLDASMLLWLALIALLAFLILNPILRLIISSLQETDTGRFTLANYRTAYGNIQASPGAGELAGTWRRRGPACDLLRGTDRLGVSRTDMPGKGFVRLIVLGAFITPPYLGAIGWILLAGPTPDG